MTEPGIIPADELPVRPDLVADTPATGSGDDLPLFSEVTNSLNGFDEIAIAAQFGKDVGELGGTMMYRAALFTVLRRQGVPDRDAFGQVMTMGIGEVTAAFRAEKKDDEGKG